jgi:fatty-acyl-CoA synthase
VSLTAADVLGYCRGELAPFKTPDQVRIVEAMPVTATGKVQKFVLREMAVSRGEGGDATAR